MPLRARSEAWLGLLASTRGLEQAPQRHSLGLPRRCSSAAIIVNGERYEVTLDLEGVYPPRS